jgi:organic radical activating enzyme
MAKKKKKKTASNIVGQKLRRYLKDNHDVKLSKKATMTEFVDAYLTAKGAEVVIGHKQSMDVIALDLTSFCNLKCFGCNHFIDEVQTKEKLTVEQVKHFVDESRRLNWQWKEVRLMGGEPTLHPDFNEVCEEVLKIKEFSPNVIVKCITNGTGKIVKEKLKKMPDGILDMSSIDYKGLMQIKEVDGKKTEVIDDFINCYEAPADRMDEIKAMYAGDAGRMKWINGFIMPEKSAMKHAMDTGKILSCQIHATCGWELTPYGFTPCPVRASVIGDSSSFYGSLDQILEEGSDGVTERLKKMCGTCGGNFNYSVESRTSTEKSDFWKLVLEEYKRNPSSKYLKPYPFSEKNESGE